MKRSQSADPKSYVMKDPPTRDQIKKAYANHLKQKGVPEESIAAALDKIPAKRAGTPGKNQKDKDAKPKARAKSEARPKAKAAARSP